MDRVPPSMLQRDSIVCDKSASLDSAQLQPCALFEVWVQNVLEGMAAAADGKHKQAANGLHSPASDGELGAALSLRALLQWEKARGWHESGGVLADPSAAMGLQWARFGLQTHCIWFRAGASGGEEADAAQLFRQACVASHGECMGWLTRTGLAAACRHFVPWGQIAGSMAPTVATAHEDMLSWAAVVGPVLEQIERIQQQLDLDDTRKSM